MSTSLIFWEILTFVVLMAAFFLAFPTICRRRDRLRQILNGPEEDEATTQKTLDARHTGGEISREEYLTIRDDITRKPNA